MLIAEGQAYHGERSGDHQEHSLGIQNCTEHECSRVMGAEATRIGQRSGVCQLFCCSYRVDRVFPSKFDHHLISKSRLPFQTPKG